MKKLLKIEGMTCGHCVMHVQSAEAVPGVKSAKVDLLQRQAIVEGEQLDEQALRCRDRSRLSRWWRLSHKKKAA